MEMEVTVIIEACNSNFMKGRFLFSEYFEYNEIRTIQENIAALSSEKRMLRFFKATFREAGSMTNGLSKGGNAIRAVFPILDRKSEIDPNNSLGTSNIKRKLNIQVELNNVFAYPTRLDQMIFNVLNLKIDAGKTVALVGPSGSGKYTIIGLVERISYCTSQSRTTLLAGTIRENIAYGREDARESEIRKAAVLATAQQFISGMKDGYDTYCGERGFQLSGGQKQGIALAHAILKNLLILYCSQTINKSEIQLHCSIKKGKVAEQGCHKELLALGRDGAFYFVTEPETGSSLFHGSRITVRNYMIQCNKIAYCQE
ncbi:hypothetical protein D5086_003621 [Populus alba]|uniref:Uncharacterized protein n=1 Tax=Populus alba TaxID=43335 RepID=A0ACC4D4U5_POPAL